MSRMSSSNCRGFTLTELAIVMMIMALLLATLMPMVGTMRDQQMRNETTTKMAVVDQALINFVLANRRLPCPADGTLGSGAANGGIEIRDVSTGDCQAMVTGVVPWITIGLSEGLALDAWSNRITYRVSTGREGFTRDESLDATKCDPIGIGDATVRTIAPNGHLIRSCLASCSGTVVATCTSLLNYLTNTNIGPAYRGLTVQNEGGSKVNDPVLGTGAAYVLISHGSDGAGGYGASGTLSSGVNLGVSEAWNINNAAIRVPPNAYYHASQLDESTSNAPNSHFDDIVSHPTILAILSKAQLAPRVQP